MPELNVGSLVEVHIPTDEELEREGVIPRGRYGWPAIWLPDGSKRKGYARPSGLGEVLDDKNNLMAWESRMVIEGLLLDSTILEDYATNKRLMENDEIDLDEFKKRANSLADRAKKKAGTDTKSAIGTALHEITECIDQGIDPGFIPEEFEPCIEAYVKAMEKAKKDHGLVVLENEQFIVNDEWEVAGTLDKLLLWEGVPIIGDTKTSQSLAFSRGKFAVQVGAYARGVRYDPASALSRTDVSGLGVGRTALCDDRQVSRDWGVIVWMPSGGRICEIVKVPLDKAQHGYDLGQQVKEWRNNWKRKSTEFETLISIEV